MNTVIGLCVVLLAAALIVLYRRVKQSLPANQKQRQQIGEAFRAFATISHVSDINASQLENFLINTADIDTVAGSDVLLLLRSELYDNAKILVAIRPQIDDRTLSLDKRSQLILLRDITLRWFGEQLNNMDNLFPVENRQQRCFRAVITECTRWAGKAVRT